MANAAWVRWDRLMRVLHLYTGLPDAVDGPLCDQRLVPEPHGIWVISGIYLWARWPRRWWGGLCLTAGTVLFAVLAVYLCR
jgi:hypothetical protein